LKQQLSMPMLVQCLFVAVHEVPEYVAVIDMDHDQHLVFRVVGTDK
jgi:hypothetical protein